MLDGRLLDLFPMGVVVMDADARVRIANERARRIFADGGALQLAGGRVVAVRRSDAAALSRLLEGACPYQIVGELHARGAFRLARDAGHDGMVVMVADRHGSAAGIASEFVLFIHDRRAPVAVCEPTLRAVHGLTRTEARIAACLVRGVSVTAIAAEVGVSANTVRTHLKRVFGKTGAVNQSALVRIVLSGPAALQMNGHGHSGT
jgi:DNA-binding CsgD family transcriptional regulator